MTPWTITVLTEGPGKVSLIAASGDDSRVTLDLDVPQALALVGNLAVAIQGAVTAPAPGFDRGRQPEPGEAA